MFGAGSPRWWSLATRSPEGPSVSTPRSLHRLSGLFWLLLAIGAGASQTACDAVAPPDREQERRQDPASPWHVHDHFKVLVTHAQAGDVKAVGAGLERYFPEREDFIELFGPTRGESMWAGYRDSIIPKVKVEAARALIKRVKAGMTTVDVERVGPMFPGRTTQGDHAMLGAMVTRRAMYTIRLRKADESLGFRLNGFVFIRGHWRAFLKSYNHLPVVETETQTVAPPKPQTVAPSTDGTAPSGTAP